MNKIVREHYPVENLPADLREGIEGTHVSVIVEAEQQPKPTGAKLSWLELRARIKDRNVTTDEAVARIRALRDEWDR